MRKLVVVGVVLLGGCAMEADDGGGGQVQSASTGYACQTVNAGQGFVTLPIDDATVLQTTGFTLTTSGNVDAVVGFSAGSPTGFTSLATAFRFNPDGNIDVRDAGSYRADDTVAYGTGMSARMIADLTTHTYSVEINHDGAVEIAHQYRFRTEQQSVAHLDHLSVIVDSPAGSVTLCPSAGASHGVAYTRQGSYSVAALAGGQAVISDGSTTQKLDARNHVLASLSRGGQVAADASGNVFLASVTGTTLSLEKLNTSLVSQWVKTRTLPSGHALVAIAADGKGGAALGTRNAGAGSVYVFRFESSGVYDGSHGATGEAVAFDGNAAFVAHSTNTTLQVKKLSTSWATLWSNTYSGSAGVQAMTAAPDGGVVFGGEYSTPMSFGGATLPVPHISQEQTANNGYVVRLSASGAHIFSQRTEDNFMGGIATNGHWIMASTVYETQMRYPMLLVYAMDGTGATDAPAFETGLGDFGEGGTIALAPDGHFWWNLTTRWPVVFGFPYLLAH